MATENKNPVAKSMESKNPVAENPETEEKIMKTLILRSSDGQEFVVSEAAATLSVTVKNLVEDAGDGKVITLALVDGGTLAKVVTYLNKHAEDGVSEEEKRKFDKEFVSGEEMSVLFDVVSAANFLDVKDLLAMVCEKIADTMKDKSVKWVRKAFRVENDFTPEEEEQIKQEFTWAWEGAEPDDD
ncbi:SKP1-like protein 11 [Sesamum alatum]|uniref:SKP1-like protein n=1 Tax=Sesamum alatum TaxID=300844 RepID=A0AAE1YK34_9LAMI|nr:SKP1-like protein 11 [Sesamum alatum]